MRLSRLLLVLCWAAVGLVPGVGPRGAAGDEPRLETVPVGNFSTVRAAGPGTLVIRPGKRAALTIIAEAADLAQIHVDAGDGELRLGYQGGRVADGVAPAPIRYELTVVDLVELRLEDGIVVLGDGLVLDKPRLYVSSGAEVRLTRFRANALAAKIDGGARLTVRGRVASQDITLQDGAIYDGAGLVSAEAKLDLCCATTATVQVSDRLEVVAAGASTINYLGEPDLTFDLSDGSTLRRLRPPAATPAAVATPG